VGPWTYYAPLWLGSLVAAALYVGNLGQLPPWPNWVHAVAVVIGAPLVGVQLQLGLIGLQGAFAQVMPVPRGRTIRGRAAVVVGALLLGWSGSGLAAALLRSEGLNVPPLVVAGVALVCLVAAGVAYIWSLPSAMRDFGSERQTLRQGDGDSGSQSAVS